MQPARMSLFSSALARQSARSVLPCSSHLTTTGVKPACTQEAGLVPCADSGIRRTVRCVCLRARRYSRMTTRPVYSPAAPEVGCMVTPSKPVMTASCCPSSENISKKPPTCLTGASGCAAVQPAAVMGIIAAAGLSFIVQEPSGIIECVREISLRSRRLI